MRTPFTGSAGTLRVDARFCGPEGTANGGYLSGRLASALAGGAVPLTPVRVTLRRPVPLDVVLPVEPVDGGVQLMSEATLVAEAEPATISVDPLETVPFEVAEVAMKAYAGFVEHPFPGCFVCGTERSTPDGLGLRPGPVAGQPTVVATTWRPDRSLGGPDGQALDPAFVWAALDCPSGWSAGLEGRPMVLGRMTALVSGVPDFGDRCVVLGRLLATDGRKSFTASTAYDSAGRLLGHAESVWIEISVR